MIDFFPYGLRNHYPHMKPADVAIWKRFIAANPAAYEKVQYDIGVGSLPTFDLTVNPETGGSDAELYRKKIDVVAHKGNNIDIMEIKPRAGPSALGQVNAYRTLYIRDFAPTVIPRAVVLTDTIERDMMELARAAGVILLIA